MNAFISSGLLQVLENDFINSELISKDGEAKSKEKFAKLLHGLEEPPAFTTLRVNTIKVSPKEMQEQLQQKFPQYEVIVHPVLPDVLVMVSTAVRTAPCPQENEVIVSLKCGLSVLRGASIYVPGVLGAPKVLKKNDLVSVYCDMEGKCLRGTTTRYNGHKYYLGNGIAQWNRRDIFVSRKASGIAIQMIQTVFESPSLNGIFPSSIFLQNLPSIVCGHVLDPKPEDTILDMCAAPGGKTTHLGMLISDKGTIIALDKTANKIQNIKANAERFGLNCIHCFTYDATKCFAEDICTSDIFKGPPYGRETFDKVLLDAPCSCLGQRPQIVNKMTPKELASYSKIQKRLLKNAVELVKRGGILVYSTCTFTIQENEANVKWTLDHFPQMKLIEQVPYLGQPGVYGAELSDSELLKLQRFGLTSSQESYDTDTIAFFIAKFTKE